MLSDPFIVNGVTYHTLYSYRPNGAVETFNTSDASAPFTFTASPGVTDSVESTATGYTLHGSNNVDESYDSNGRLLWLQAYGGRRQTLTYDASGRVQSVTDAFGHQLTFAYNAQGTVATVTDSAGNVYSYQYDANANLTGVTKPPAVSGGQPVTRQYVYEDPRFPHAVTGIIDELGNRHTTWSYDANERAIGSQLGGGVLNYTFAYGSDGTTRITDPLGTPRTFSYQVLHGVLKTASVSGGACDICGTSALTQYGSNDFVASRTDFNGNVTTYQFDSRGLENSRTEASGTPLARTITTTWDPNFRLPTEIDEPGRKTTLTYDALGNLLSKTVTDTVTGATRTWTYTYNDIGQVLTADGPRTDVSDVTTYAYYPIVAGDPDSGQLHTVTDALGHVTTIGSYDADGHALTITDPNGLVTVMTWTPRGQLASVQRGGETTRFDYDAAGELTGVTLPTGAALSYAYDAAQRLTTIRDQLGDQIVYTLDAMGNRTKIETHDPSGALTQTRQQVFDALNRLQSIIGAQGQTTDFGYDAQGNLTRVSDPLQHVTQFGYDALNRLVQTTDPANGVTSLALNALDQITAVTDPRLLVTGYAPDALGNVSQIQSPDSGSTGAQYDTAGNLVSRTDAKGQATTYQYDALNRLILVTRADTSQVRFTYDESTNGIGRLTGMTDPAGATAWRYDLNGHLLEKSQTVGAATLATAYAYDANGRLISQTLPSGHVLGDTWTNGQITALTLDGNPLVSDIAYQPFGGPKTWTFANGETDTRAFDLDGRIISDPVETLGYDAAARITGLTLGNHSALADSKTYGYDALDRLTAYTGNGGPISYTYDASGNRTSQIVAGTATTYQISLGSNQLDQVSNGLLPRSYLYARNGSVLSDGLVDNTYDAAERLVQSQTALGLGPTQTGGDWTASYVYDGLNERVEKTVFNIAQTLGITTTLFTYDPAGRLIGEYDETGAPIEETVWLGALPLAVVKPTGVYYIHADRLNTPRQIDDSNGNAVWAWDPQPFGDNAPNEQPGGSLTAKFVYNLRFAGQYFDAESLHSYNLNRDYDPAIGRYIEVDPLGLAAGINPRIYVVNNPVSFIDPLGLCDETPPNTEEPGLSDPLDPLILLAIGGPEDLVLKGVIDSLTAAKVGAVVGKITGYTRHGLNQAISREGVGVAPKAILDAVKNPGRVVQQADGAVKYVGKDATVILNKEGKVITTYPRGGGGVRAPAEGGE